jgi:hypothetical protein
MRGASTVKVVRLTVRYDCSQVCGMTDENPSGDMASRRACRCSLPGFDSATWDPEADPRAAADAERLASDLAGHAYQAGISLEGFELDVDGCPRGWADAAFGVSVMRYAGARTYDEPRPAMTARMLGKTMHPDENTERLQNMVDCGIAVEDRCYAWFRQVVNR